MTDNNIMTMIGAFIGVAIMLGIGVLILGNAVSDCTDLPDYNTTIPFKNGTTLEGSERDAAGNFLTVANNQVGWAAQCLDNNDSTQSAWGLIVIVLIVIAAVVILAVVKML